MVIFTEHKSSTLMQANSTHFSPLESLKCVSIVLNNSSDKASSSSTIWPAQSGGPLSCLCCSPGCVFTGCFIYQMPIKTTSPSHVLLLNIYLLLLCLWSCFRSSDSYYYSSSCFSLPCQSPKLFLDADSVIQHFGCPSVCHLGLGWIICHPFILLPNQVPGKM